MEAWHMKYTNEETLKEILRRRGKVLIRRREKNCRILVGTSACLFTALIGVICLMPGKLPRAYSQGTVYGAFLLSPQAGGYVLAAVIAFALGVTFVLLCQRYRKRSLPGVRGMDRKEGFNNLSDEMLLGVAGRSMGGGTAMERTEEGTCPYCQKTRYKVTVTQYTENGPWEHTYYECDQCGRL